MRRLQRWYIWAYEEAQVVLFPCVLITDGLLTEALEFVVYHKRRQMQVEEGTVLYVSCAGLSITLSLQDLLHTSHLRLQRDDGFSSDEASSQSVCRAEPIIPLHARACFRVSNSVYSSRLPDHPVKHTEHLFLTTPSIPFAT